MDEKEALETMMRHGHDYVARGTDLLGDDDSLT
jgi:hypothetical protein